MVYFAAIRVQQQSTFLQHRMALPETRNGTPKSQVPPENPCFNHRVRRWIAEKLCQVKVNHRLLMHDQSATIPVLEVEDAIAGLKPGQRVIIGVNARYLKDLVTQDTVQGKHRIARAVVMPPHQQFTLSPRVHLVIERPGKSRHVTICAPDPDFNYYLALEQTGLNDKHNKKASLPGQQTRTLQTGDVVAINPDYYFTVPDLSKLPGKWKLQLF